jgi:hypothetical protein
MKARIMAALSQVLALFVDDGHFALAIVVWIAATYFIGANLLIPAPWDGILLFVGFATILLESTIRRARR